MEEPLESQCESNQVSNKQERNCQPCKKKNKDTVAGLFCRTCGQFQCIECCSVHEVLDYLSGHEIVPADDAKKIKPAFDMQGLDKCKDHEKYFEDFCADHNMLCCSTCVLVSHRACPNVQGIFSEASKNTLRTSDVESEIQKLQERANVIIKVLESRTPTPDEPQSLLEYIEKVKLTIMNKFDQLKMTITVKFKRAKSVQMSVLDKNLSTAKAVLSDLQRKQDILTTAKMDGSVQQKFVLSHLIEGQITPYQATLKNQETTSYQISCSFDCNKEVLQILNSDVNLATFDINNEPIDFSASKVENIIKLKPVTSVKFMQSQDDTKTPLFTGMDFFPDGRLAVVDNPNYMIYVMSVNLEVVRLYKFDESPHSVAVVSNTEIAVTCRCSIAFLHVNKTNVIRLTRTVKTSALYYSICLMNEKTFLVSTYDNKLPVKTITMTGEEKEFTDMQFRPRDMFLFNHGAFKSTYIPNKHTAVFHNSREMYMFDTKKADTVKCVIKTKTDSFYEMCRKGRLVGVCLGPDDCCILLSSKNTSTSVIDQWSPSGKHIGTVNLDMKDAHAICVSNDGKRLAVTSNTESYCKLKLFHLL